MKEINNMTSWNVPIYTQKIFNSLSEREQLHYICRFGILAPSTHNTQPWKFCIETTPSVIKVYLDKKYVLPASDVTGRQSMISIGCAIENIIIAGSFFGLYDGIVVQDVSEILSSSRENSVRYVLVAIIRCKRVAQKEFPARALLESILTRKVTRAEFNQSRKISASIVNKLKKCTVDSLVKLHLITDPIRRRMLAEFQAQADGFVINSPLFSRELGNWLLPNETEAKRGMPGIGFGLQDQEATRMHRGLSGDIPLAADDGLKFALGGKAGIEKSPLICVLSIADDTPKQWVEAGRIFERMFLLLNASHVQVALHAGVIEVALVHRMFSALLGTRRRIAVLFRCGYVLDESSLTRPHSPRVSIDDMIIDASIDSQKR